MPKLLQKTILVLLLLVLFVHQKGFAQGSLTCPQSFSVNNAAGTCGAVVRYTAPKGSSITTKVSDTFSYTGTQQYFEVPAGVSSVQIQTWGAQGGGVDPCTTSGGLGGSAQGTLRVQPGDSLHVFVGGQPAPYVSVSIVSKMYAGGYNGGGTSSNWAGGGGGASDVRKGDSSLNSRVIVAGGGGGASEYLRDCFAGGAGGGLKGGTGTSDDVARIPGGRGGTQTAGGAAGSEGLAGSLGQGGGAPGVWNGNAGGGGGYYGGGSAQGASGGGGSGYTGGVTSGSMQTGVNNGNGMVVISYNVVVTLSVVQTAGLSSGSTFPVGTTTNTFALENSNGEKLSECSSTVTVTDNENPTITCPSVPVLCSNSNGSYTIPTLTASDNCGIQSTSYSITGATTREGTGNDASGMFNTGISTITWTVTDIHSNQNTCQTTVTVNPTPTAVADVASQTVCSGTAISSITLRGAVSGTTYNWMRDNTTGVTGMGSSGSGDITGTLSTASTSPQTTTFTITPSVNGCTGAAITASVTVNPSTAVSDPAATTKYVVENAFFNVSATGTGTLGYTWQVNTGSGWSDLANGGVYSGATTNTLTLTGVTYAMNGYQYRSVVSGDCGTATSNGAALTVNKRPVTLAYTGGTSVQYSDQVNLSATFSDASGSSISTDLSGRTITFTIGTQTTTATTNSSGVASTILIVTQAPGNYTLGASFDGSSDLVYQSSTLTPAPSFTITKEDTRAYYTGSLFASTSGATSSTATVTLSATIKDITAVSGDLAYDIYPGDIRHARVMFVNRDQSNAPISGWLTPGLVSSTDSETGTVTYNWSVNIGTQNSQSYNIGIVVDAPGYYTRNTSTDDQVVTVSKPLPDFVTGGGYLVLQSSAGLKAGDPSSRNNFGFNVKYNRSGTNLQGNINAIVRRTESDGIQHVYQVKGNSMTSLAANAAKTTAHPYPTAVFDGKASITDITDPLAPVSVDGGASLHVTMTDRGDPGSTDGIAITVWNKSGGLWFSSDWNSTTTIEQTLAGGNLKVSTNSSFSSGTTTTTTVQMVDVNEVASEIGGKLTVTVLPNPSHSYFTLHTQSGSDKPLVVQTVDVLGRQVETRANIPANGTLMLGGNYRPGIYFTQVLQGNERITLKLIKQPN